jgi:hypothetical protein
MFLVAYENLFVFEIGFERVLRDSTECPPTHRWLKERSQRQHRSRQGQRINGRRSRRVG